MSSVPAVAPTGFPMDGGVCALRRWEPGKSCGNLFCCCREAPGRTRQDGEEGRSKEQRSVSLALCRSVQPATSRIAVGPEHRADEGIAASKGL